MAGQRAVAFLLMLIVGLVGCGNGDKRGGRTDTKARAAEPTQYCAASLAVETAPEPNIDFTAPPEQQAAAVRTFAKTTLRPLTDKFLEVVPAEIRHEGEVASGAVKSLEETGDFAAAYADPEVVKAFNKLHAFDLDHCSWRKVGVTAADYSYAGVPPQLPAGVTSFDLDNKGTEQHEMVIFRRNDGETMTFDQLLAIEGQEELLKHVSLVGAVGGDPNSKEDLYAIADVKPGDYVMVCFVAVGSTPDAVKAAESAGKTIEGPPHFTRGMKAEFKVA